MKIAIDSGPLTSGHKIRGVGFYTKNLIASLGNKVNAVDVYSADLSKYDIIHIPYFNPFVKSLPNNVEGKKLIVTIHDLIPLIYPERYSPGIRGKMMFFMQKQILKKAAAIITDCETSKKDIIRFIGVNPEKIHVVYLAQATHFKKLDKNQVASVKKKYKLPDKFVLYVGDINYNKNIPNLVKACEIAKTTLVICGKQALDVEDLGNDLSTLKGPRDWVRYLFGKPHPELAHYKELLKLFEKNKKVLRLGFVPDEDLVAIYNLATVYCQPSFYEGFGLPVLEAIACGSPVVASQTQALVEIAEGAATFVNPRDPKSIADGFKHIIKNPKLPREYSWKKVAAQTMKVYEED
ncbi:MAG: glycosyltransferase family 1 protein [Patescibacteria group bacterium]